MSAQIAAIPSGRVVIAEGGYETPCWFWCGARDDDDYGKINRGGKGNGVEYVHRLMYRLFVGEIPGKYEIDHKCRNHSCCNPEHLEAVTSRENKRRGDAPNWVTHRTGVCKRGHDLNLPGGAVVDKQGRKKCRLCQRLGEQRRRAERKRACVDRPMYLPDMTEGYDTI